MDLGTTEGFVQIDPVVAHALKDGAPVLAFETSVIAHGLPPPQNLAVARSVEQIARDAGAVPATIGILDGRIKIGLTQDELAYFARSPEVQKVSRRDIAFCVATGRPGATTAAATMICARMAGIVIFVTGGIGGVHRGWQETLDISADLTELAQTNVAVVCAGAKAILDLPTTLEYLETKGVPVIGYGTDEFPAFYARRSGLMLDFHVDSPEAIAHHLRVKWGCGIDGGVLIVNPIPEAQSMDAAELDRYITGATDEARAARITGGALTPFILERISGLSEGKSLAANVALLEHNAQVGSMIAKAYAMTGGVADA